MLINWKTGEMTIRKRVTKSSNPFLIPVKVNITIKLPEQQTYELKGEIKVSETQVTEMMVHEL